MEHSAFVTGEVKRIQPIGETENIFFFFSGNIIYYVQLSRLRCVMTLLSPSIALLFFSFKLHA